MALGISILVKLLTLQVSAASDRWPAPAAATPVALVLRVLQPSHAPVIRVCLTWPTLFRSLCIAVRFPDLPDSLVPAVLQAVATAVIVHRLSVMGFINVSDWVPPELAKLAGLGSGCGHQPRDSFIMVSNRGGVARRHAACRM